MSQTPDVNSQKLDVEKKRNIKVEAILITVAAAFLILGGGALLYTTKLPPFATFESTLGSALLTTGIIIATFQWLYYRHHKKLMENIASQGQSNLTELSRLAKEEIDSLINESNKLTLRQTLRSLIAGGDLIWRRLESELIKKPFYAELREIVYVLEPPSSSKKDLIKVVTYEHTIIRNTNPLEETYLFSTFSEFNDVETSAGADFGYDYINIDGEPFINQVGPPVPSGNGKRKQSFSKEFKIKGEGTLESSVKMTKYVIKHDFFRKQVTTATEKLLVQLIYDKSIRTDIWISGEESTHNGVGASHLAQFVLNEHQEYENYNKEFIELTGFLKNESFVLEWSFQP